MAVTVDELLIKIELSGQKTSKELSKISTSLDKVEKNSNKTSKGVRSLSVNLAKFAGAAFVAVKSVEKLANTLSKSVKMYMDSEDAVTRLNIALELSGSKQIPELVKQYTKLGDELQYFGVTSTDTVLKLAKIGVAAGQTTEQTQKLIRTAADLSVAREIPLEQAFNSLSKTIKGSAGALSIMFPELQNFSEEQLKAGAAVNYLSYQLGGFAASNLRTYSGQISALNARLEDVQKEFGKIVVASLEATGSIAKMNSVLIFLKEGIEENSSFIKDLFTAVFKLVEFIASFAIGVLINFVVVWAKLTENIIRAMAFIQKGFDFLLPTTKTLSKSLNIMANDLNQISKEMYLFTVEIFKNTTAWDDYNKSANDATKSIIKSSQDSKKALSDLMDTMATNEQRQAMEALKNKTEELEKAYKTTGKTALELAEIQAAASIAELESIKIKISGTKKLTGENLKLYNSALLYIQALKEMQIEQINAKAIDELASQYESIGDEIARQNMTQREFIDYQLKKELEILEIKRQAAEFASGEAQDLLDLTEKRLKAEAAGRKRNAPMQPGDYINDIKDSFKDIKIPALSKEGLADFTAQIENAGAALGQGMMAAGSMILNYVGMAIDMILNLPDMLLSLFIELPKALMSALIKIPEVLDQITKEFPKIVDELVEMLPGALVDIFRKIPDFLFMLMDQIPRIIEAIAEALPHIFVIIVANLPKLIGKFIKMILNSIIGFIKGMAKGIRDVILGRKLSLDKIVDTKGLENKIKRLTGETGKMFSVENLTDAAQKPLDKIGDSIKAGGIKARDYILEAGRWLDEKIWQPLKGVVQRAWAFVGRLWETLKDFVRAAWKFVSDLWEGLKDIVSKAWQFVKDLWDGLGDIVSGAWQAIIDFFNGIGTLISSAWQGIVDFFKSLPELIKQAWQFVVDLFNSIGNIISGAFQWVIDKIITPLGELGKKIAEPIGKVFEGIKDLGGKIWEGLKSGLQSGMSFFTNIGSKIWESLKSGLSGIGNFLKNIFDKLNPANLFSKIFKVDMGGKGTVESTLGIDVPFLKFAKGGVVPGNSPISGDSALNDRILAMLSPGEAVVPRSRLEDPKIAALVQAIIDGDLKIPEYAFGVKLPNIGGTLGSIWESGKEAASQVADDLGKALSDIMADPWKFIEEKVFKDMIMAMLSANKFAQGGLVTGMGFGTDTVPAMLTPGEFVMSRRGVEANGIGTLSAMNRGQSSQGGDTYNINFEIQVDAKTTMDEGYIRGTLIPKMSEELRRASLDGKFVISARGIR